MRTRSTAGSRGRSVVLLGLLLLGSAAAGRSYPLWYQHYERGLVLSEEGRWSDALDEFQGAAAGEPRARKQIRTYGSRFIFDYDPDYQQARCLAELGRFDEAREKLSRARSAGVTPEEALSALGRRLAFLAASTAALEGPESGKGGGEAAPAPRREAVPTPARLMVESIPAGAAVTLDGKFLGRTPLREVPISAAPHRVHLFSPGFEEWEQEVSPDPGEQLHLDVALRSRQQEVLPVPTAAPPRLEAASDAAGGVPGRAASEAPASSAAAAPESPPEAVPEGTSASPAAPRISENEEEAAAGAAGVSPREATDTAAGAETAAAAEAEETGAPPVAVPALLAGLALLVVLAVVLHGRRRAARLDAASEPTLPHRRLGGYRVLDELGRGGMAVTYRARRLADDQIVALKIPHQTGDPTYLPRFLQEGRLGETLHHPGIVRILEAGEDRGVAFLAMEVVPGRQLRAEIDACPEGLPVDRALGIAHAIAEAMDYAHSKGVVHRDLKPENIMLLPDGALKVMDFGVARVDGEPGLTSSQFFFGSPLYAAPELIVQPRSIDRRIDLYSLGVVLFELLEGKPPFVHESIFKVLEMHQREPLPELASLPRPLPREVWAMVRRLLEKDPERRYGSAQELLVDLKRLLFGPVEEGRLEATRKLGGRSPLLETP